MGYSIPHLDVIYIYLVRVAWTSVEFVVLYLTQMAVPERRSRYDKASCSIR